MANKIISGQGLHTPCQGCIASQGILWFKAYQQMSYCYLLHSQPAKAQMSLAFRQAKFENIVIEPVQNISNNVVCATSKSSDQPAHTCSLIRAYARRLNSL